MSQYGNENRGSGQTDAKKTPLDPSNPLDGVVTNLIETVHRKGRGFVLGVANEGDGKTSIEIKESIKPHDEFEKKVDYRAHTIHDTASMIVYAGRYGTKEKSLMFVSAEKCQLVIDEEVERGEREVVELELKKSDDWTDWNGIVNKPLKHRELGMFLLRHAHNVVDPTVITRLMKMSATATVDHTSELNEFGPAEVGFKFKTNGSEDFIKFPKTFGIQIPVLDQDVGDRDNPPAKLEVRLQIEMPSGPTDHVKFTPMIVEWNQAVVLRTRDEIKKIREALEGWTVVHGEFAEAERKIPTH